MKYSRGAFAFKLVLKNVLALVMILFDTKTLHIEPKLKLFIRERLIPQHRRGQITFIESKKGGILVMKCDTQSRVVFSWDRPIMR